MVDDKPPLFRITLRAERWSTPVPVRLRRLMKAALRAFGFRCLCVEEVTGEPETDPKALDDAGGKR